MPPSSGDVHGHDASLSAALPILIGKGRIVSICGHISLNSTVKIGLPDAIPLSFPYLLYKNV